MDAGKVDTLLYAGTNLGKAQEIFANAIADQVDHPAADARAAAVAAVARRPIAPRVRSNALDSD